MFYIYSAHDSLDITFSIDYEDTVAGSETAQVIGDLSKQIESDGIDIAGTNQKVEGHLKFVVGFDEETNDYSKYIEFNHFNRFVHLNNT